MIWCTKCVMCFQNECLSRMVISPRGSVANATFESQQGTKAHGCLDLKASQWRGKRLRMNDINKLKLIHCQHNVNTKYSIATVIEWDHVNHVWQTARVGRKLQYKRPYLDCCFWIVSMLFSDVLPVTIGNSLSENNFQQMWSTTSSLELCPRSLQQWSWDLQFLVCSWNSKLSKGDLHALQIGNVSKHLCTGNTSKCWKDLRLSMPISIYVLIWFPPTKTAPTNLVDSETKDLTRLLESTSTDSDRSIASLFRHQRISSAKTKAVSSCGHRATQDRDGDLGKWRLTLDFRTVVIFVVILTVLLSNTKEVWLTEIGDTNGACDWLQDSMIRGMTRYDNNWYNLTCCCCDIIHHCIGIVHRE